ncbi:hypothetical protein [Paraburkholderia sp.]|jgi:hypothetical protein|uniref:hypothetical protein n=1 Tax=Paraburkholderia sp. TaxID=1926495 RepID=UPI002F41238A
MLLRESASANDVNDAIGETADEAREAMDGCGGIERPGIVQTLRHRSGQSGPPASSAAGADLQYRLIERRSTCRFPQALQGYPRL